MRAVQKTDRRPIKTLYGEKSRGGRSGCTALSNCKLQSESAAPGARTQPPHPSSAIGERLLQPMCVSHTDLASCAYSVRNQSSVIGKFNRKNFELCFRQSCPVVHCIGFIEIKFKYDVSYFGVTFQRRRILDVYLLKSVLLQGEQRRATLERRGGGSSGPPG